VTIEYTDAARAGETANIGFDYLINATGPKLNFGATPGLGPDEGYTTSVCTPSHALHANEQLQALIAEMKQGATKNIVVGTGHGMCTCQGAAFEYIYNVDHTLREAGVRDKARLSGSATSTNSATSAWAACISSAAVMSPTARPSPNPDGRARHRVDRARGGQAHRTGQDPL
jgi:hypothetical protein